MKNLIPLAAIMAAAVLASCGGKGDSSPTAAEAVKVETAIVGEAAGSKADRYSGTIEEENGTLLSFAVGGTVSNMLVDEGDRVSKGQLIATLDPEQMRSNHASAKAALEQAEDAYGRMKELHGKGSLPEIKWVEAQTALERARAAELMARKQLADCRLYAPFSGVISKKFAERGQNVGAGTQVVKAEAFDGGVRAAQNLLPGIQPPFERAGDIAFHGHGKELAVRVLKDGAHALGNLGERGGLSPGDFYGTPELAAEVERDQSVERAQQRRFPAAGRPGDEDRLAFAERERNVRDRVTGGEGITVGKIFDGNHRWRRHGFNA